MDARSHAISQQTSWPIIKRDTCYFWFKWEHFFLLDQLNYLGNMSDTHSVSFKPIENFFYLSVKATGSSIFG